MSPLSRGHRPDPDIIGPRRLADLDAWSDPDAADGTDPDPDLDGGDRRSRRLRIDPGRPGAALLCVVAVLAGGLAAALTWLSRPSAQALPPVAAVSTIATSADPTPSAAPAQVVVSVIGQVLSPGLVTLPTGARVADAVAAAGGALPGADLGSVNLARVLVDGEQVAVGVPGAALPGAPAGAQAAGALVNLNTATESELDALPGVGPVLAGRILDWRAANGGFTSVEDLRQVDGIGPSTFDDLKDLVTV